MNIDTQFDAAVREDEKSDAMRCSECTQGWGLEPQPHNRKKRNPCFAEACEGLRFLATPHNGGDRIRTCDLEVMSLASYRAAPPRDMLKQSHKSV